ncbi:conserved Plasmodium protein, unknown function [Plasmodium malariae]|uniref:Uncharacterized protein n=1 Tax=Plasmodium malariae TaxID=5858 RepID=A0A1C3KZ28_PLAMA|nr:conserved Plasmodium protein, unknown function [Plasmodium malariae]
MDTLIKINDKLFIDLNNYHEKVDDTEDLNIFETNHGESVRDKKNDAGFSYKMEIKKQVDIFTDLVKEKNINYDISRKFKDNNLDIIKTIKAINNSYIKNEEFHFTRLMMLICLKNYIFEFVNKYLKNLIRNYEEDKYKKEIKNFNSLIHSKDNVELDKHTWNNGGKNKEETENAECTQTNFLVITFLSKSIIENYTLLENLEKTSKHLKEEEWTYLKEKILLLIKNSCIINDKGSDNFTTFVKMINKDMYKSFKRYKSIIEMKKFNICLYFIDIFFSIFLIDYPYKWHNVLGNIFDTFKFISFIKNNDFRNVLNTDYNSTIYYIMDLSGHNDSVNEIKYEGNSEKKDNYSMVIQFQNFYSLMFLMNKMLKKYIPRTHKSNYYSVIYHNYFISYINNSNKNLLQIEDYSDLKIPCENLLLGFEDIIKIFFPFFNRLLYSLLKFNNNIYIIFITKKIVKFLYKTLVCHFISLPEGVLDNELEILFTNIMEIIDINLHEYVNNLYFVNVNINTNELYNNEKSISVSKITEESSYENLSKFIHNKRNHLDKLFLIYILKSKKWCLKILNLFLYRSINYEEMNDTWKLILKHFENKYIIFLEKISVLILKITINTTCTDEERMNYNKLFWYIKYIIDYTDYLKFSDKCLSLSVNYLCMIISLDNLRAFVKQNILSEIFLRCLFFHINSSSHIECIDNFFTSSAGQKESLLFDNLKFERYIICFEKIPLFRKYLLDYYDDTKSKNILKKYVNYIIFLFCELLEKYFYDIIFDLDKNVKDHLRTCLVIQNEYMHLLYPEMFLKKELDFSNEEIEICGYKNVNFLINSEVCMRTENYKIHIKNIIDYISKIIQNHMKENKIEYNFDFTSFYMSNCDTFNSLLFIIKNLPLYKYSQDELIFKDLYSVQNEHNLNYSCLIMNDISLYKYFSLFMFLTYYKYLFIKKVLENIINQKVLLDNMNDSYRRRIDKEDLTTDHYIEEYYKNKCSYISYFNNDANEISQFESITDDFKIKDKSFFLNYMLVNLLHPYSNNLKRVVMWMLKEYINMTRFSDNVLQFFFYISFINLFYFEKHLKFRSFDTLVNLMYKYGIPREIFYNDYREIFIFLFFQLLILFIKNESTSCDNIFYWDNININLSENYEKIYLLKCLREDNIDCNYYSDVRSKICKNYLYNQVNCFTDFFINDVLYNNFHFYMEKMEESNLNQFLNFISMFYQNEINNNIILFINLLNESLLDITSSPLLGNDKGYSFLRTLKFFSFFLEHYKNASSTQDVLIIKILQNDSFIVYFKHIIRRVKNNELNEEILNEIYYILYIFTKNSLFNYKIFWFYFLYSLAHISNDLNIFHLREINKIEKIPNIPIYVMQFFSNVIKRDVFYVFFSLAEEKTFRINNSNISLIEILRKISLLLICLSDENINEQNFCNNSTIHICGLYLYNSLLSYLFSLLTKNKILFTHLFWSKLRKAYNIIQDDQTELSDIDDTGSNYSFKKFDEAKSGDRNFNTKEFIFKDTEFLFESIGEADIDAGMEEDLDLDVGEGAYDIFYIYQNSDDLKYFILAYCNILIYLCMYKQKREMVSLRSKVHTNNTTTTTNNNNNNKRKSNNNNNNNNNDDDNYGADYDDREKDFCFLKGEINSINNLDKIIRDIDMEYFNEYAIEQLGERLHKIINAIVNVVLMLPIPYKDNVKVFNKNVLRRLAPICGEGDNIEHNNLLKFNSENSMNDRRSSNFKEIHFNDLLQNIEFMHVNNYEQKFYERKHNSLEHFYNNVVHINKSEDLKLYDKNISVNYYFQNNMNDDFVNRLISECNCEHFQIFIYVRKAFSLLTQEIISNENLINIIGCSDKYYNFINIIRLDI